MEEKEHAESSSDSTSNKQFESDKFLIDSQKCLYKKVDGELKLLQKLSKKVFEVNFYDGKLYFIDTFGDCFVIENDEPVFLFGILSYPAHFSVLNHRIYAIDKHSRVWVTDLDGEILNIAFVDSEIMKIHLSENYCSISTNGLKKKIAYGKTEEIDRTERVLLVFDRSFDLLSKIDIEKVVEFGENHISYEVGGNKITLRIDNYDSRKKLKSSVLEC